MKRQLGRFSKYSQLASFVFAALLHVSVYLFIPSRSPVKPLVALKPVDIVFTSKPKSVVQPKQSGGVSADTRGESSKRVVLKSESKSRLKPNTPIEQSTKGYEALLPKAIDLEVSPSVTAQKSGSKEGISSTDQHWKEGLGIEAKRVLLRRSGQIFNTLDLPLGARLSGITGQAIATLKFDSGQRDLILESLIGLPILRAALYEAFLKPENLQILLDILNTLEETTLKVTLQAVTRYERKPNDDPFRWNGNRLIIYTTVAHDAINVREGEDGSDPSVGIVEYNDPMRDRPPDPIGIMQAIAKAKATVPRSKGEYLTDKNDYHGSRAKARDDAQLKILRDSPAYGNTLSNRKLNSSPL